MSDSKTVKSGENSEAALKDLRSVMQGMTMPYSDADMRRLGLELLNFVLAGSQHSRISSLGADAGAVRQQYLHTTVCTVSCSKI